MKNGSLKLMALLLCLMMVFVGCAPAAPAPAPAPEVTEADYEAWAKENGYVKADEVAAPAEEPEEEVWDKEVDLLVMGCGPAGVSAAVEAVDNGCESVMIIEKTAMIGGTSLMVYPAAGLINYYRGHTLILVNRGTTGADSYADLVIHEKIGEVFSQL